MYMMIATIRKDKNTIIGFRLLDMASMKCLNATYSNVVRCVSNTRDIRNLRVRNGRIVGYNGAINRYPVLNSACQLVGKSSIIVLGISNYTNTIKCCDFKGNVTYLKEDELVTYAKANGIANGKIVSDKVHCIEGGYSKLYHEIPVIRKEEEEITDEQLGKGVSADKIREYRAKSNLVGNKSIKSLKLDSSNKVVVGWAKHSQKKIIIPNFVETIDTEAFYRCIDVEEIIISSSVKYIKNKAFIGSGLKKIAMGESVKSIGEKAFLGCDIDGIKLPNSLTSIGEFTFAECKEIEEIVIPSSVVEIGNRTFADCSKLRKASIEADIRTLPEGMFINCIKLREVTLPDSIQDFSIWAFNGCTELATFKLPYKLKCIPECTFANCRSLREVDIPSNLEVIGKYAFSECHKLRKLPVSNNTKRIDESAFYKCLSLKKIVLPDSLEFIGKQAFMGHKLERVELGLNIKSIGNEAFLPSRGSDVKTEYIVPNNEIGKLLIKSGVPKKRIKLKTGGSTANDLYDSSSKR